MKSNLMLSSFHPKSMMSDSVSTGGEAVAGSNGRVVVEDEGGEFNMSKSEALGFIPFPALVMTSANVGHLAAMVGERDFFKMGLSMPVCLVVGRPFATKAIKARMNTKWWRARLISKPLRRRGPETKKIND